VPRDHATGTPPQVDAIVVAAGSSRRMDGIDKLLAPIAGRPLLARTVSAIAAAESVARIVIVTAEPRVAELAAAAWLPPHVVAIVAGGQDRSASVAAGLAALDGLETTDDSDPVVLVHDGARPLVTPALVDAVARAAAEHGAAIPVLRVAETLKRISGSVIEATVDRSDLVTAQTPQGARRSLLRDAFERFPPGGGRAFTDEAALLEACTITVHAIPGEPANLKVTVPDDLRHVEASLRAGPGRIGYGHDSHPFGPGEPLALGGVTVPGAPRLHGHSDGDVALHALADALLGAAGLGDLGRLFPADARTPSGIASTTLLGEVVERVAQAGFRPSNVDLVIVGARPRLGDRLDAMRGSIARLVGLAEDAVNVKASTGNLAGMEGAGRGISARAIAQLEAVR
jgi:2-C-methyl-D-erythritol 4-phosphate cytidylyltransferase/2-C-methyl-D-erythritol 2,4-cyclodiphosphate synthase